MSCFTRAGGFATTTVVLAFALACGGASQPSTSEVGPPPGHPVSPADEATTAPAAPVEQASELKSTPSDRPVLNRSVLVVHTAGGRCLWQMADATERLETVHEQAGPCPSELDAVWFDDRIARVDGADLVIEPWRAAGATQRIPLPAGERSELRYLAQNPGDIPAIYSTAPRS